MRKLISILLALLMLASLCAAAAEEDADEEFYEDFYLTAFDCEDLDGNPADITLFDGAQLVLIDCWEPWCYWCLLEMPDLNELYELNRDNGLLIVGLSGISPTEGYDAKEQAEELGITYPLVNGTEALLPYELQGFPTTYVFQRQEDGGLLFLGMIEGYMDRESWNAFLQEYLPGAVTEAETESVQ